MTNHAVSLEEALMWLNDARGTSVDLRVEVNQTCVVEVSGALSHWTEDEEVAADPDIEELMGAYQVGDDVHLQLVEPGLELSFRLRPHFDWGAVGGSVDVGEQRIVGAERRRAGDELVIELGQHAEIIVSRTRNAT